MLLIGEKAFAVQRHAGDSWKTNVSQGGKSIAHRLTKAELQLAVQAAQAVAGVQTQDYFLGVDLLPTQDGTLEVLEVNAVPGWRGLQRTLDIDIADELTQFLLHQRG